MNITVWDLFKYVFKWKWLIIFGTIGFFALSVKYTGSTQSYNAQTIIRYNDSCILDGKTPDNEEFDPYEIVSPDVITSVINDLSLKYSVDKIRSRVEITSIIPESEVSMKEAKMKEAEEYTYHPNTFCVTYEGRVGEPETLVRDILDSIIENYLDAYQFNYINQMAINDMTFDEDIGNYDYIEIVEIMDSRIDSTVSSLNNYYAKDTTFRSPKTGYSFSDIQKEYEHLQEYTVSKIFSNIFEGQITKNKKLLLEKYNQRDDEYILSCENFKEKANVAKERMDAFSDANINVPNSYNSSNNSQNNDDIDVLKDVYDDYWRSGDSESEKRRSVTTTFDTLIQEYVDASIAANNAKLNSEYCEDIIHKFTVKGNTNVDIEALTKEIENDIVYTKTQMNELYKTLSDTIDDYNDANASKHISQLTGVQYYNTKSLSIYALIFTFFGFMITAFFAIAYELIKKANNSDIKEDNEKTEKA